MNEVTSEDFGFAIADPPIKVFEDFGNFNALGDTIELLTIGNKTGIVALSNIKTIKFGSLADLKNNSLKTIDIKDVRQIFFNSSETKLWVLTNDLLSVDLQDFSISLIHKSVSSCKPNPKSDDIAFIEDGALFINDQKFPLDIVQVTWSMDGQRLYLAKTEGGVLVINKSNEILNQSGPNDQMKVITMMELTPSKLLVGHLSDEQESITAVLDFETNDSEEVFIAPSFGSVERPNYYYSSTLNNWAIDEDFVFVTSAKATDISVVSVTSEVSSVMPYDDSLMASFPINDETGDDASPFGLAIDLSNKGVKVSDVTAQLEEASDLPKIWCFTHEGTMLSWWIFDVKKVKSGQVSLQRAIDSLGGSSIEPKLEPIKEPVKEIINPEEPSQIEPTETEQPKSAFGSTGFGSTGFGQGPSSGVFGSTGFGSTGLGSTGFGSAFGSTGFGGNSSFTKSSTSNQGSGFGSYAKTDSSFGKLVQKESPFGNSEANVSPFANLGEKPSIFGTSGEKSSPFGSLAKKDDNSSPFGSLTKKDDNSSPFGSLTKKDDNSSPFGSLTKADNKPSPFGSFAKKDDKPSPLGASEGKKPQFGSLSEQLGNTSIFGSANKETSSFGNLGKKEESPFASLTKKEESPFASLAKKEESPFASLTKKEESPFANLQTKPTSFSSFGNTAKPEEKQFGFGQLGHVAEKKESPFAIFKKDTKPQEATKETEYKSREDFGDNKGFSFGKGALGFSSSFGAALDSTTGLGTEKESESKEDDEPDGEADEEDEVSDELQITNVETNDDVENNDDSNDDQDDDSVESGDSDTESFSSSASNAEGGPNEEGGPDEEGDSFEFDETDDTFEPIKDLTLEYFDGFTRPQATSGRVVNDKIKQVINTTHGHKTVLEQNIAGFKHLIHLHNHHIWDAMEADPSYARLGMIRYMSLRTQTKILKKAVTKAREIEPAVEQLVASCDEDLVLKYQIHKALTHLSIIVDDKNVDYPLDYRHEQLQGRLRTKLKQINSAKDELVKLMIPLKARVNTDFSIDNLKQVLFQINEGILDRKAELFSLSQRIESLDKKPVTEINHGVNGFMRKWELSNKLTKPTPRFISN